MDDTSLVLFDLDGTLYRSTSILPTAYQDGIKRFNDEYGRSIAVPDEEAILAEVGNPAEQIYRNLFPELESEHQSTLSQLVLDRLAELIRDGGGELIEGVPEVLGDLSGRYDMGLVTNARVKYMDAVVETHNLEQYFDNLKCIGMVESDQKVTLVNDMLEYFGRPAEGTVMIGDRRSDYDAATGAGTRFIGCQFGYSPEKEFPDDHVIDEFPELLNHPFLK